VRLQGRGLPRQGVSGVHEKALLVTGHNEQWQPRLPVGARLAAVNGERWLVVAADLDLGSGNTIYTVRRPYLVPPPGSTIWDATLAPLDFRMSEEFLLELIHSFSVGGEGSDRTSPRESPAVLPRTPEEDGRRPEDGAALDRRGARRRARHVADWRRGSTTARAHVGGRRQRAEGAARIIRDRAKARRIRHSWLFLLVGLTLFVLGVGNVYWGVTAPLTALRAVQVVGGLLAYAAGLCLVTVSFSREAKRSRPRQRKQTS